MKESEAIRRADLGLDTDYVAPDTPNERAVVTLFETVFDVEGIGLDDDFFDLGGDSLHAEALSVGMEKLSGRDFRISDIGDYATPRMLAEKLEGAASGSVDSRPIIFLVHGAAGYTMPPKAFFDVLGAGYRVHVFELPGLKKVEPEIDTIPELASHYLKIVQDVLPEGDINLGSFCKGALIAIEMARQSEENGRRIRALAMFDPNIKPSVNKAMQGDRLQAFLCGNGLWHRWSLLKIRRKYERNQKLGKGGHSMLRAAPRAKLMAAYARYFPSTPSAVHPPLVVRTRRKLRKSLDQVLSNRVDRFLEIEHNRSIMEYPVEIATLMKDYFDDPPAGNEGAAVDRCAS